MSAKKKFFLVCFIILVLIITVIGIVLFQPKENDFTPYQEVLDKLSAEYGFKIEYYPEMAHGDIYSISPEDLEKSLREDLEKAAARQDSNRKFKEEYGLSYSQKFNVA